VIRLVDGFPLPNLKLSYGLFGCLVLSYLFGLAELILPDGLLAIDFLRCDLEPAMRASPLGLGYSLVEFEFREHLGQVHWNRSAIGASPE